VLRSVKYGLYAAVLVGLLAVPVAWSAVDKSVNLVVDGKATTVRTTAAEVRDVLRDGGYRINRHDLVAPAPTATVHDGSRIVLRRGRLLHLQVDGRPAEVWTTAPTVAQALDELGYGAADFVSVSRSRRLPLSPTELAIRTPQPVTVVHDGAREQVSTTAATVADLLDDLELSVGPDDRLTPAASTAITAGTTVRVQRVDTKLESTIRSMPYPTRRVRDSALRIGTTRIVEDGAAGRRRITYSVVYVDGTPVARTKLATTTVTAPRPRVIKVGTKPAVKRATVASGSDGGSSRRAGGNGSGGSAPSAPTPSPGSAKAIARKLVAARGWSDAQYDCLVILWNHESSWRVHASNPSGAYGIPQALPGSKMASAGPDWQNNAETQIKWGLKYIAGRYQTPCGAWSNWQAQGWY
jgi:uncharacterized protein YabE (DUF348 family)